MKAVGAVLMVIGLMVAVTDDLPSAFLGVLCLGIGYVLAFAMQGKKGGVR